jgi:signal transduction histidine kinase/DNA-binding response OmpR family regulator
VTQIVSYLQAATAIAFVLLGVATSVSWLRRRDRSLGFLALAIVLLALVVLLTRVPDLSLLAFMGSGYALLRFRASLIPLSRRWHAVAALAMLVTFGGLVATRILVSTGAVPIGFETVATLLVILVWSASVVEPIVRFWLVARDLPAVQAWRLRSLSLGFASLVALIAFAVGAGAFTSNPAVQILIQLIVLAIVPLLYVSFSPPAWLRRQWRTREEQGLSQLMQDLLVLRVSRDNLIDRSLDVVTRLVGASAAVAIDPQGTPLVSRGLDPAALLAVGGHLAQFQTGHGTVRVGGIQRATLTFPISLGAGGADRLVLIAGAFTPDLGSDEANRAHQLVTALSTAFDRLDLIDRLETSNGQLLEANRHKSTFLANMSHELRTPLNAILGFSELLSDDTTGKYNESTRRRFLDQIHTSGQHLLQLINDILDLSKVEAGQMDLQLQQVAVADSIDGVLATVEPLARLKEITLDSQPDPDLNLVADAAKLKQMLLNLVSNAIKFNPVGGRVTIRARQAESWIEIAVSDTGIGIAKADLGRLFTEFQQLDSGPGRQQEGTGLGLALTKRFAELHGGKVSVESVPGKGSTFTLRLPLEAKPTKEPSIPQPQPIEPADPRRPLILVVEDNPEAAELLARHLDAGGFRMEIARTGADALTMARALKPVAITLDILLPEIDGWEVLTRLKDDELTQNIPIVVVSVVDNPALGRALGALDYFVKPVDGKALLSRLAQYTFTTKVKTDQVRILVVDDEPANLDLLEALLTPAGFSVLRASGGQEGIDMARSQLPNLILLDLMMPRVTGFEVVEALRSEEPTRSIPIMVLTAKVLTEDDKRALNGHVAAIFQRNSVAGTELVDWIRKLIAKRRKS